MFSFSLSTSPHLSDSWIYHHHLGGILLSFSFKINSGFYFGLVFQKIPFFRFLLLLFDWAFNISCYTFFYRTPFYITAKSFFFPLFYLTDKQKWWWWWWWCWKMKNSTSNSKMSFNHSVHVFFPFCCCCCFQCRTIVSLILSWNNVKYTHTHTHAYILNYIKR